jgi:hypothetical protein
MNIFSSIVKNINRSIVKDVLGLINNIQIPFFTGSPPIGVGGEGFVPLSAPTGLNAYALGYSDVINPSLLPITASVSEIANGRRLTVGSFQPIQWRYRFSPTSNSANTITLTKEAAEKYDSWREGMLNGGEVRVWRVINGVMTHVRTSTITAHRASGWGGITGHNTIVPAGTTSFTYNFQSYNRPNATQWFSVCAVSAAGNQSNPATAATHTTPASWPATPAAASNTTSAKTLTGATDGGITVPTGVVVTPSNGGMTVTISWNAVGGVDGYIVLMSDYNPALHAGYGLDLSEHATPILAGDMVFAYKTFREIDRATILKNRVWDVFAELYQFRHSVFDADALGPGAVYGTEGALRYALVDHDIGTAIPGKGQTFARITVPSGRTARVGRYNHASKQQFNDFYPVLSPNKTYRVECWIKADANRTATFDPALRDTNGSNVNASVTWNVTTAWQKFTYEFTPASEYTYGQIVQFMRLDLGEGVWDVDSLFIFEAGSPHLGATPTTISKATGLGALRFHEFIKTSQGSYGLDQFTNAPGMISCTAAGAQTCHSSLDISLACGVNPWLQVEMHFSPEEWDGFIEWLAGTTGAWAEKRIANGRIAPWTDAFDTIYFEVSNETWNNLFFPWTFPGMTDSVTSVQYSSGEVYGLFQEYVIDRFKASPHWTPELEGKFKFVLGGWGLRGANSFTSGAVDTSPNSHFITIAAYNGGWEAGAGVPIVGDSQSYRNTLTYTEQGAGLAIDVLKAAADGIPIGSYEAGPGYVLNGLNGDVVNAFQDQSQERVMKSKVGGVATIDVFLRSAQEGMVIQNYFTFSEGYRWTSHAHDYRGGGTFPAWQFVELFNEHCTGLNMLGTTPTYTPQTDLPAVMNGQTEVYPAKDDAEDVAFYVFRGGNKLCLWAVSRKLPYSSLPVDDPLYDAGDNGVTSAYIRLPINNATSVKRYRMNGNYNQHNVNPNAFLIYQNLSYDGGTIAFTPGTVSAGDVSAQVTGSLVTGATSGATAQIYAVIGNTTSGYLSLYNVQGTFQNDENLLVSGVPNAVVNGTIGGLQSAMILDVADPLYADLQITETTLEVADVQNFTIPGGMPPATADLYVFEDVSNVSISGVPSVSQVVITPTTGVWPIEISWTSNASAYPLDSLEYEVRRDNVVVSTQTSNTYSIALSGTYTVRPIVTSGAQVATFSEDKMLALYNGEIAGGRAVIAKPVLTDPVTAYSGGTKTSLTVGDDGFDVYTFDNTAGGSITFDAESTVRYLIVAGGGAGGAGHFHAGGGGGAGGLLTGNTTIAAGTYPITVGAGGAGATNTAIGGNGGNSVFNSLTAIGGGAGGHRGVWIAGGSSKGQDGGSGGGSFNYAVGAAPYGLGTAGQGNNGGHTSDFNAASGGGGAGAPGNPPLVINTGGAGGNGLQSDITGTAIYYAGGGGGASGPAGGGAGGLGGGGAGTYNMQTGNNGTNGLGGGGGGISSGFADHLSGAGGSGVVIIRVQVV